jgi:chaperonin GroES
MKFALDFRAVADSHNADALLTREESDWIARTVVEGFEADKRSRAEWEKRYKAAHELALQVTATKTYPWEGASNVKFPLLTVATLQFSARAYGALVKAEGLVRCKVIGADPTGEKRARAERIAAHMSYQMLEQDEGWEEAHDKALMAAPIVGSTFIKSYYDPVKGHNCATHVLAWDLVVNYHAQSLETADRITHCFPLYAREIKERQLAEIYSPAEISIAPNTEAKPSDDRQGIQQSVWDDRVPYEILEQQLYLDLDGDGYEEPYIATVAKHAVKLLRLVNRFGEVTSRQGLKAKMLLSRLADPALAQLEPTPLARLIEDTQSQVMALNREKPDILKIDPMRIFTKIPFVPSPDGGFYDLGYGALLGPVNESVNTAINQLLDAGTLANMQGGFIGRGARIKGGQMRFKPGEWKRIDVAGQTLRDAIVPLPVTNPSPVLFQLLGLLIQYGERIASVSDVMSGENPGQNTPAYNMQAMMQQGMAVFTGIFKRMHRAFRDEFRVWYLLNRRYLTATEYFQVMDGNNREIYQSDYQGDPNDIRPAADPNAVLSEEKNRQSGILAQRAGAVPGYNMAAVELRILEASGIANIPEIFPTDPQTGQPVIPPPQNPEIEFKREEEKRRVLEAKTRHDQNERELQLKALLTEAQVAEVEARTIKTLTETGAIDQKLGIERGRLALERLTTIRELTEAAGKSADNTDAKGKPAGESRPH